MKTIPSSIVLLAAMLLMPISQAADKEPGVLLKSGEWGQAMGSYGVPKQFEHLVPAKWPKDRWYSLVIKENDLLVEAQSPNDKNPEWLKKIVSQIPEENAPEASSSLNLVEQETDDILHLRVPDAPIKEGKYPLYVFKNGGHSLNPELDYQYRLKLNDVAFGMRVQNGLKGKNGAPYGEGATYFIEYDGKQFEYALGYYGWASRIIGITDIDGDGFPDFIIEIDGSNSIGKIILLSSTAKPGKNSATAILHSWGC